MINDKKINAKSPLSIMSAGIKENTEIELFEISIFSSLKDSIINVLLSLDINPNDKTIRYSRNNNGTSYLLIKLNDEDENDLKNYVSFGAKVIRRF